MARKRPWGSMADPRSRIRRLAGRIEREELKAQYPTLPPFAQRCRRRAARYLALAEQVMDQIGTDPKATPRRLTALQKAAEGQLKVLQAFATPPNGHHTTDDLAERLLALPVLSPNVEDADR